MQSLYTKTGFNCKTFLTKSLSATQCTGCFQFKDGRVFVINNIQVNKHVCIVNVLIPG